VDVVIQPAAGASVTINGGLDIAGSHFTLKDVTVTSLTSLGYGSSPTDVTLQNINGENFNVWGGASFITFKGGDWGPSLCYAGHSGGACEAQIGAAVINGVVYLPHDITFDGIYMHDFQSTDLSLYHDTCMFIISGYNFTIRNSKFRMCSAQDIFMQDWPGYGLHDVTIENNWIDAPRANGVIQGNISLSFSGRNNIIWTNFLVRNNTIFGSIDAGNGQTGGWNNTRIIGNAGEYATCQQAPGLSWSHNVWTQSKCSSTDKQVASLGVVSVNNFDYHLTAGSPAIDAADPTSYPSTDIDGQNRPAGGAPDAGADESG
jgi:hypothetical protein